MSCYFVANISIENMDEYNKYLKGFDDVFERFNGEVLAVDEQPIVLEGTWNYSRAVIMKFPSVEEARRWYDSPEYQALKQFRVRSSTANIVLVRGE
jgi:uncharacterized protein (DUF1330 family)